MASSGAGPALADVIAHRHAAQAGDAGKGRGDGHLVQARLRQRHGGFLHLERAGGLVPRLLADEALALQFDRAPVMSLGQRQIGPRLRQLGARHGVVQTHQRLPAPRAALPEIDALDAAGHFRPQHHGLVRAQAAHGRDAARERHLPDRGDLHPLRHRLGGRLRGRNRLRRPRRTRTSAARRRPARPRRPDPPSRRPTTPAYSSRDAPWKAAGLNQASAMGAASCARSCPDAPRPFETRPAHAASAAQEIFFITMEMASWRRRPVGPAQSGAAGTD